MKKGLFILLALIIASSVCAFTKGTINPGGTVSFTSYKPNSDQKAITKFGITPQVGYFVIGFWAIFSHSRKNPPFLKKTIKLFYNSLLLFIAIFTNVLRIL